MHQKFKAQLSRFSGRRGKCYPPMMLRHPRDRMDGQPIDNTFEVLDERSGQRLGASVLYTGLYPVLFPTRPHMVRIRVEGEPASYDRLMGASLARARQVTSDVGLPTRIFTECRADDDDLFSVLTALGFRNNDGLIRMQAEGTGIGYFSAPAGSTLIDDDLTDLKEQTYFLERYNKLFREDQDRAWLEDYASHADFRRFLCLSRSGLMGEVVVWNEDGVGVVDYVQTSRKYRHQGTAKYLIGAALEYLRDMGIHTARAVVRARWPYAIKTFESAGFIQSELIMRYPGIDVD